MSAWMIVASPFVFALLLIGVLKASEAYHEWRETEAMRVRDARLQRYNLTAFRGSKNRWLS